MMDRGGFRVGEGIPAPMGGYYDGDDGRQGNKNDAISTESAQACLYNPIGFCIRAW